MEKPYGLHQTLDCYKCDEESLDNEEAVFNFLNSLPGEIGMHKICDPKIVRCGAISEKDPGGVSGFVMISESHISIHTYPKRKFFTMDVYSCNKFDTKRVKDIVSEIFGVKVFEENIIVRGKKFAELATMAAKH